jgi:hypothetical protein
MMMQIKTYYVYTGLATLLMLLAFLYWLLKYDNKQTYKLETIKTPTGWGYTIRKNDQLIIYQEHIPAQEGESSFQNKETAKMTGELVINKLNKNEMPSISKCELDSILNIDNTIGY